MKITNSTLLDMLSQYCLIHGFYGQLNTARYTVISILRIRFQIFIDKRLDTNDSRENQTLARVCAALRVLSVEI